MSYVNPAQEGRFLSCDEGIVVLSHSVKFLTGDKHAWLSFVSQLIYAVICG